MKSCTFLCSRTSIINKIYLILVNDPHEVDIKHWESYNFKKRSLKIRSFFVLQTILFLEDLHKKWFSKSFFKSRTLLELENLNKMEPSVVIKRRDIYTF